MSVHSTTIIDETYGKVYIHPRAHILPYCIIRGPVSIAIGCTIGPFASIGGPPEVNYDTYHRQQAYINRKNEPYKRVRISERVSILDHCVVTCGTDRETLIGEAAFIFKGTKISHDCRIGPNVIICGANIAGHVSIMKYANLGMNVAVHQGCKIGSYAMVGMGAVVTRHKNVTPFSLAYGVPVKEKGINKKYQHIRSQRIASELDIYYAIENQNDDYWLWKDGQAPLLEAVESASVCT